MCSTAGVGNVPSLAYASGGNLVRVDVIANAGNYLNDGTAIFNLACTSGTTCTILRSDGHTLLCVLFVLTSNLRVCRRDCKSAWRLLVESNQAVHQPAAVRNRTNTTDWGPDLRYGPLCVACIDRLWLFTVVYLSNGKDTTATPFSMHCILKQATERCCSCAGWGSSPQGLCGLGNANTLLYQALGTAVFNFQPRTLLVLRACRDVMPLFVFTVPATWEFLDPSFGYTLSSCPLGYGSRDAWFACEGALVRSFLSLTQ